MAEKKKFKPEEEEACSINMGSLIDCTFLLLLYFITVSEIDKIRFSEKVTLPIAKQGILEEDKSGRFIIDVEWEEGQQAARYKVGSQYFGTAGEITPLIAQARGAKNFRVVVRGDRNVPYEFTQEIMAAVAAANVPNLMFSTKELE